MTPEELANKITPMTSYFFPEDADGLRAEIAALIREAVAAEREACADMAGQVFDQDRLWENVKDGGERIAAAIRARGDA